MKSPERWKLAVEDLAEFRHGTDHAELLKACDGSCYGGVYVNVCILSLQIPC